MSHHLSRSDQEGVQRYLDQAEVLQYTVDQLRKDLSLADAALPLPSIGDTAFEVLRGNVLPVLEQLDSKGEHALRVAIYRVDIPEPHFRRTMANDGLHGLAGEVVLRALQKVLSRLRYAGRL